jgi:hypothetical protein
MGDSRLNEMCIARLPLSVSLLVVGQRENRAQPRLAPRAGERAAVAVLLPRCVKDGVSRAGVDFGVVLTIRSEPARPPDPVCAGV